MLLEGIDRCFFDIDALTEWHWEKMRAVDHTLVGELVWKRIAQCLLPVRQDVAFEIDVVGAVSKTRRAEQTYMQGDCPTGSRKTTHTGSHVE